MAGAVKGSRRYDSSRRRAQAEATRIDILEAAERLFTKDGYAATTMASIATEAGVSLKTVYLALGTKSEVLRALWNLRLRGGEGDAPVAERAPFQEILAEPDAERQLRLNAAYSRQAKTRIGPLFAVIHEGAAGDPDIAALWKRIETEFHAHQRKIAESLHRKRALKRGLGVDKATDLLWTLNHPAQWELLAVKRGWSGDEFEAWLGDAFCAALLRG